MDLVTSDVAPPSQVSPDRPGENVPPNASHVIAPGIPLDHPLIIDHFDSVDFIEDLLKKYGSATGVTYIRSSSRSTAQGVQHHVYFICNRAGHYEASGAGVRKRRSIKTNCKWAAEASQPQSPLAANPMWVFSLKHNTHNHGPLDPEQRATNTRKLTPAMRRLCEECLSGDNPMPPREIIAKIKERWPDAIVTSKDIQNYRAKLQRESSGAMAGSNGVLNAHDANTPV